MVKEKLVKLINVKTIITFMIVGVVCILGLIGKIPPDNMFTLGTTIVSFYFGSQVEKKSYENQVKSPDENKRNLIQ